jgi:sodium-dependent dicarboxylate transporter 2/3/5
MIGHELSDLGPLKPGEKWTLLIFLSVALAWIFRTPKEIGSLVIPGITTYSPGITDATIAICGALILFMLPVDSKKGIFTLDWESAKGIPWGILILFGGGICLSEGIIASGLAEVIANSFTLLAVLPLIVIILVISLFITFLNEVVSNTAMASIMVPLMAITSVSMGINPLMLMVPAALASSLGRAGLALNVIGCILITVFMTLVIPTVLGISPELPAWAVIPTK